MLLFLLVTSVRGRVCGWCAAQCSGIIYGGGCRGEAQDEHGIMYEDTRPRFRMIMANRNGYFVLVHFEMMVR
uniref:Putative secreted peptide n=1 Tax=Anopheles braziliensis TaxID=58242 RepID=A0A2M3ZV62_9DIPT